MVNFCISPTEGSDLVFWERMDGDLDISIDTFDGEAEIKISRDQAREMVEKLNIYLNTK